MSRISRVSIFRNEYDSSDPKESCSITLQPDSNRIAFETISKREINKPTESVIYDSELRNSIGYAISRWLGDGHPVCSYGMRFNDAAAFRQWRQSVLFEDCDVSWHVVIECKNGQVITYVCIGQYPFPAELAEIVREVIEHRKHHSERKRVI